VSPVCMSERLLARIRFELGAAAPLAIRDCDEFARSAGLLMRQGSAAELSVNGQDEPVAIAAGYGKPLILE
jgi:hypothetical protein